jgi:hypothetical protein
MRGALGRIGRLAAALVALCCLSPGLVCRALADENYDLFKFGSQSCDEWIRHSDLTAPETPKWFESLLAGLYQSGGYRIDFMNAIKSDQVAAWLDGYCRANPLDGLAVAATVLTNELAARAVKKE